MKDSSDSLLRKLKKLATDLAKEKPKLHFFGVVQRESAPPDRWDLLISSDALEPWSFEAIRYVATRLKKILNAEELVRIAKIVVLPPDNALIADLQRNQTLSGKVAGLHPMDHLDQAFVIWPTNKLRKPAKVIQ